MVQRRANVLVMVGLLVVVVGGGLVWFTARHKSSNNSGPATVAVVVANTDITAGSSGDDVVTSGKVSVEQVKPSDAQPNVINSEAVLSGRLIISDLKKGSQITTSSLRSQPLRNSTVAIPAGMNGVAVTLDATPGAAGYANAGDTINIFAVDRPSDEGAPPAITRLLLSNVEVLDVSQQVAPSSNAGVTTAADGTTTARSTGSQLTFLLALNPTDAERVIFATSMNHLYFSIVHKGDGPALTPGANYSNSISAH